MISLSLNGMAQIISQLGCGMPCRQTTLIPLRLLITVRPIAKRPYPPCSRPTISHPKLKYRLATPYIYNLKVIWNVYLWTNNRFFWMGITPFLRTYNCIYFCKLSENAEKVFLTSGSFLALSLSLALSPKDRQKRLAQIIVLQNQIYSSKRWLERQSKRWNISQSPYVLFNSYPDHPPGHPRVTKNFLPKCPGAGQIDGTNAQGPGSESLPNARGRGFKSKSFMQVSCSSKVFSTDFKYPGGCQMPWGCDKFTVKCPGAGNFFCSNGRGCPGGWSR